MKFNNNIDFVFYFYNRHWVTQDTFKCVGGILSISPLPPLLHTDIFVIAKLIVIWALSFLQSAKILLLPLKYEIIMVPSNHSNFLYCDSIIGLFSSSPCQKLSLLILFAYFFVSFLCFFFDGSLSEVITLSTIAITIVVALSRSMR